MATLEELAPKVVKKIQSLPATPTSGTVNGRPVSAGQKLTNEEMFNYIPDKKEVGIISSDNGQDIVASDKNKLDEMTATTGVNPGQESIAEAGKHAGATSMAERQAIEDEGAYKTEELVNLGLTDFSNFTQTSSGKWQPTDAGYADLGITGVNENQTNLNDEVASANDSLDNMRNEFLNYNIANDEDFTDISSNISSQFDILKTQMNDYNKRYESALSTTGFRTGSTRYAPGVQAGIIITAAEQGMQRISDIITQENSAILAAKSAYKQNKFAEFSVKVKQLENIRNEKATELSNFNQSLADYNNQIQEQKTQIAEQKKSDFLRSSVLDAISQGFTDPIEILTALELAGVDATVEDVTKYTSLIQNEDTLAGLDQNLRTYEWMKKNQPDELKTMGINSYKEYLRITGDAKRAVKTGRGGAAISGWSSIGTFTDPDTGAKMITERNKYTGQTRQTEIGGGTRLSFEEWQQQKISGITDPVEVGKIMSNLTREQYEAETQEQEIDTEAMVWQWLSSAEAQDMSNDQQKQQIMQAGLDPSDFGIY